MCDHSSTRVHISGMDGVDERNEDGKKTKTTPRAITEGED